MRSLYAFIVACFALTVAPQAMAEQKFGYVDMARALNDVDEGKEAKQKLKNQFDAKQKELDKLQNDLKSKKDAFDKQARMMKADAREAKQNELQQKFMELQQTYSKMQQELINSETDIASRIGGRIRKVVESIGDRDGYTAIFNTADSVIFYRAHMDITDEVVKLYNKRYNGAAK